MLKDNEELACMGHWGSSPAEGNFTWAALVKQMEKGYAEIIRYTNSASNV